MLIFPGSHIEMLEVSISPQAPCCGIPLHRLPLPPQVLIAACKRAGKAFIPYGNDCLQSEDTILLLQDRSERSISQKLFHGRECGVTPGRVAASVTPAGWAASASWGGIPAQSRGRRKSTP